MKVEVYDSATPNARASIEFSVTVKRNVNKPTFEQDQYQVSINDSWKQGDFVARIKATDNDNETITYSITGDDKSKVYFHIDENTGVLSARRPLSEDDSPVYEITIQAKDKRGNLSFTKVIVRVPRDLYVPVFEEENEPTTILENVNPGSIIKTVKATDQDLKQKIKYGMDGFFPSDIFFSVNENTGEIKLIKNLKEDNLATEKYTVNILFKNRLQR